MARDHILHTFSNPRWSRIALCAAFFCASAESWAQAPRPADPAARKPEQNAAQPADKPDPKSKGEDRPAVGAATAPTGPGFVFLEHARNAGVSTCLPMLQRLGSTLIDSEQSAVSTWEKTAPDTNVFTATSYSAYADKTAPRSLTTLVTTPKGAGRCDGAGVRIQPSRLSCETIAANLKSQNVPDPSLLGDIRVYPIASIGVRPVLLPTASGDGCVVITQIVNNEK